MKIPENIIERVREQNDIVEIIGESVQLQHRGRNYIGLCPFHNEKTPSFNVLPDRGIFKCFGCGKGGNVLTFVMEHQKMNFVDAVVMLAARAGIEIPKDETPDEQSKHNRYDEAYNVLRTSANHFYKLLIAPEGKQAMEYLTGRGFGEEIIKKFGLGFSPDGWDGLVSELKMQSFQDQTLMEDAGLAMKSDNGKLYDRFRGRLMFPIQNPMGKVIGFGARRLKEDGMAKYINSPQSLVYNKSQVLYGIFQAKDAIRKQGSAILVEGYADLLSVYQAGFQNVVASSGTALTREQLKLIFRYCQDLKIVYDGDTAGINAAVRGLDLALEEGFEVSVVRLPSGEDPDSFIRKNSAKAFQEELKNGLSLVDFKGEILREQGSLQTSAGQAEAVRSLVETISKSPDPLRRDFMIRAVAMRFSLGEHQLYDELNKFLKKNQQKSANNEDSRTKSKKSVENSAENINSEGKSEQNQRESENKNNSLALTSTNKSQKIIEFFQDERNLFRIALSVPGALSFMTQRAELTEDNFQREEIRRLFNVILMASERSSDPLQNILSDANISQNDRIILSEIALQREQPSENWKNFQVAIPENISREIRDCIVSMTYRNYQLEYEHLRGQLRTASSEKSREILLKMKELDELRREIGQRRES